MSDARTLAVPASATLSTALVARLRDAIMCGELLPGSKLNLYRLRTAFGVSLSPLREALCRLENDGLVALIRPADEVPKTLLLGAVVPALSRLIASETGQEADAEPLRLRVAVHSGEVHRDGPGFFGEALDVAYRVLAAPRVREYARAAAVPVTLAITEEIFWSIVRHGYPGIEPTAFAPLTRINAGRRRQIWIHVGSWQDSALADLGTAAVR